MNTDTKQFRYSLRRIAFYFLVAIASKGYGRVGETLEQVEERYGKPLPQTHPIFTNKTAAALLELPKDDGINLTLGLFKALLALQNTSKDRSDPGDVKGNLERTERIIQNLDVRCYLFKDTLVQVVLMNGKKGPFSVSESYLHAEESSSKPGGEPSQRPAPAANLPIPKNFKMGEWFTLGEFDYRIENASVSRSVVNSDPLGNAVSDAILSSVEKEANSGLAGLTNVGKEIESNSRFLIVRYVIRNNGSKPHVILADDFKVEDGKGRHFTPDAEVTAKLVETTDKSTVVEELQPGIERRTVQGFRIPADIANGRLTLTIPEKGILGKSEAQVVLVEGHGDGRGWELTPISADVLKAIVARANELQTIPAHLQGIINPPSAKSIKSGLGCLPIVSMNVGDGVTQIPRIWLDLSRTGDVKSPFFDFLVMHDVSMKMEAKSIIQSVDTALKKSEATKKQAAGF